MFNKNFIIFPLLSLTLVALLWQALHPAWYSHMSIDTNLFYLRSKEFVAQGNFSQLEFNEYQPTANLYILSLSPLLNLRDDSLLYRYGFFGLGLIFLVLIGLIYKKIDKKANLLAYCLILLATGPIVLFRFEAFVAWLILLAILFWKQKWYMASGVVLGVVTMAKVYPVLLVPYFIVLLFRNGRGPTSLRERILKVIGYLTFYILGMVGITFIYLLIVKVDLAHVLAGFDFHTKKTVYIDSVWASIIGIYTKLTQGRFPGRFNGYGIVGLAHADHPLPLWFFNYFWIVPVTAFYGWLMKRLNNKYKFDARVVMTIILLFLVTNKGVAPQYLLWFSLLFPLVTIKRSALSKKNEGRPLFNLWWIDLGLIAYASLVTQYIFPLHYSEFAGDFYSTGKPEYLFWLYATGHLALVVLLTRQLIILKNMNTH